jgi:hypothetical protein
MCVTRLVPLLSGYQAIRLSGYQAIRLSGYQAIRLSGYQAIRLSGYQLEKFPIDLLNSIFKTFYLSYVCVNKGSRSSPKSILFI